MSTSDDPVATDPDDVGAAIADAIELERRRRGVELREGLDEVRLLRAWLDLDLPPHARAQLQADLSDVKDAVLDALLGWQRLGGIVTLAVDSPMLVEVPAVAPEPEPEPEPDPEPDPPVERVVDEASPEPVSDAPPVVDDEPLVAVEPEADAVVPAEVPEPSPEPAPPASSAQLAALEEYFTQGPPSFAGSTAESWVTALERTLSGLHPCADPLEEEERVCSAVRAIHAWTAFPKGVQRLLVGLVACRLRSLQDDSGREGGAISAAFSSLTAFSAREQPGFVFGLARSHRAQHGSWAEDADRYWDELTDLLPSDEPDEVSAGKLLGDVEEIVPEIAQAPEGMQQTLQRQAIRRIRAAMEGGVRARNTRLVNLAAPLLHALEGREFRALRRAIRELEAGEDVEDASEDSGPIPEDWAWWGRTRGRRALMVGGDPREPNRQRLEQVFGFESLEWQATTGKPQSLQSIATRVRRGSVDVLIILTGFVGHNYDNILLPACREADVDWVAVDHGYGSARIRRSIERFLDADGG